MKTTIAILLLAGAAMAADIVLTTDPSATTWVNDGNGYVAVLTPTTTTTTIPTLSTNLWVDGDGDLYGYQPNGEYVYDGEYNGAPSYKGPAAQVGNWYMYSVTQPGDYRLLMIGPVLGDQFLGWGKLELIPIAINSFTGGVYLVQAAGPTGTPAVRYHITTNSP